MHLSWLGNTAIKIQTKPFDQEVVILIDPYKPSLGSFPRNLTSNIALYSRGENESITISGDPFILSAPGEIETKGVLVTALQGHEEKDTMFRIDTEDLSVGHLGLTTKELTDKQLEVLSGIDILLIPISGNDSYDVENAIKVINTIEPRIIIPINYKSDNNPKAEKVEAFLKEMSASDVKPEKKVIIKKKDLPQEETRVVLLAKE